MILLLELYLLNSFHMLLTPGYTVYICQGMLNLNVHKEPTQNVLAK